MADPIPHDLISGPEVLEEAVQYLEGFFQDTNGGNEHSTILAAAWAFEDMCEEMEVDPLDTLCQLLDLARPIEAA